MTVRMLVKIHVRFITRGALNLKMLGRLISNMVLEDDDGCDVS